MTNGAPRPRPVTGKNEKPGAGSSRKLDTPSDDKVAGRESAKPLIAVKKNEAERAAPRQPASKKNAASNPVAYSMPPLLFEDLADQHERRFRQLMILFLILAFVAGALIPLVNMPEPPPDEVQKLPPHLAKVIIKKRPPKPPPKPLAKVIEAEVPKAEKKVPEPKPEKVKPKPKPKAESKPKPVVKKKPEPKPTVADARKKAASTGIFAAQDALAGMRKTLGRTQQKTASTRPLTTAGKQAVNTGGAALQAQAAKTSGGPRGPVMMRMSAPSQNLEKSDVVVAAQSVDIPEVQAAKAASSTKSQLRSEAAIRKVFDQHKGAIDSLYRRALRRDPGLQGRVVVEVVIEPAGSISQSRIIESQLQNKALEARLLARIRLINFGEQPVAQQTVQYAFEFVPN